MQTYTKAKPLVSNSGYDSDRRRVLEGLKTALSTGSIDEPMVDIVERFARVPCCYTLQSCYGHFVSESCADTRNTERAADMGGTDSILHYRIAYIAFCIQNSVRGRMLLEELRAIADIDLDYVQFGSADWFWKTCLNSYVLQVSPLRGAHQDSFDVSIEEALRIEQTRDEFFDRLRDVLSRNEKDQATAQGPDRY